MKRNSSTPFVSWRLPHSHSFAGLCLLGLGLFLAPPSSRAATPILNYNYNDTGTNAANSGSAGGTSALYDGNTLTDLHGADGTGVSGNAGDRALALTNGTMMGTNTLRQDAGSVAAVNGLTSFTIAGWFKTAGATQIGGPARLVEFETGSAGFKLWTGNVDGALSLTVNGTNSSPTISGYGQTNEWVFFAVTYDGALSSTNLNFYMGNLTSSPTLISNLTFNHGSVASVPNDVFLNVGNNQYANRGFDGWMDNFAIYGSANDGSGAISSGDIIAKYNADLIPEPSVISLVALAILGVGLVACRRKQTA